MKRISALLVLTIMCIFPSRQLNAQAPQKISYQAVIRDSDDQLMINHAIGMQISILEGTTGGSAIYVERHFPTTNSNGLVNLEIGTGVVVSGNFSIIDWENDSYFVKNEIDLNGGANYTISGTSQLLSVPYALHAQTVAGYPETDPVYSASVASGITTTDTINWNNKPDIETDPVYSASVASGITATDTINWNNKPDIETDPVFSAWDKDYNDLDNKPDLNVYATKNMGNENITNLADPVNAQDAATKTYVDAIISRLSEKGVIAVDIEGNIYSTIRIGTQIWMAENLKTTTYKDGTAIPLVTDKTTWGKLSTPAYCWYDNDAAYFKDIYGALYNWHTINTAKLCPTGWHVPGDAEWITLIDYLGGISVAGGKLKEAGTIHWNSPNTDATNESGFTALPGGYRNDEGAFGIIYYYGFWWTANEIDTYNACNHILYYNFSNVGRDEISKLYGFSVRCIRD